MRALPHRGVTIHTDRLSTQVAVRGGTLRDRVGQPTDLARWYTLERGRAACRCGRSPPPPSACRRRSVDLRPDEAPDFPSFYAVPGPDGLHRAQRFAAYAVATDPADRVLLTRIAPGYPGAGCWHLPGGGTDYGEQPGAALIRELVEETGQHGRLVELLGVASHRDAASLGPGGLSDRLARRPRVLPGAGAEADRPDRLRRGWLHRRGPLVRHRRAGHPDLHRGHRGGVASRISVRRRRCRVAAMWVTQISS